MRQKHERRTAVLGIATAFDEAVTLKQLTIVIIVCLLSRARLAVSSSVFGDVSESREAADQVGKRSHRPQSEPGLRRRRSRSSRPTTSCGRKPARCSLPRPPPPCRRRAPLPARVRPVLVGRNLLADDPEEPIGAVIAEELELLPEVFNGRLEVIVRP